MSWQRGVSGASQVSRPRMKQRSSTTHLLTADPTTSRAMISPSGQDGQRGTLMRG